MTLRRARFRDTHQNENKSKTTECQRIGNEANGTEMEMRLGGWSVMSAVMCP